MHCCLTFPLYCSSLRIGSLLSFTNWQHTYDPSLKVSAILNVFSIVTAEFNLGQHNCVTSFFFLRLPLSRIMHIVTRLHFVTSFTSQLVKREHVQCIYWGSRCIHKSNRIINQLDFDQLKMTKNNELFFCEHTDLFFFKTFFFMLDWMLCF